MKRFDAARRRRILAWTGAALAWGTAVTIAVLEPHNAQAKAPDATMSSPPTTVVPASQMAAMPHLPARGLVILKFQSSTVHAPEMHTVYVQQEAASASSEVLAQPAPAPESSGS